MGSFKGVPLSAAGVRGVARSERGFSAKSEREAADSASLQGVNYSLYIARAPPLSLGAALASPGGLFGAADDDLERTDSLMPPPCMLPASVVLVHGGAVAEVQVWIQVIEGPSAS